jgi:hypothetical protein
VFFIFGDAIVDIAVVKQLLLGAIPPGVIGAVLFALLWMRRSGGDKAMWRGALTPLLIGVVYAACHQFVIGITKWPPGSSDARLPFIAAGLGLLGAIATFTPPPIGWGVRLAGVALAGWASLPKAMQKPGTPDEWKQLGVFVVGAFVAAMCAEQATIEREGTSGSKEPRRQRTGPGVILVPLAWLAVMTQLVEFGFRSLKLMQTVEMLCAITGGALLVSFWRRELTLYRLGIYVLTVMTCVCLLHAVVYNETEHGGAFALLAATGPALWFAASRIPALKSRSVLRVLVESAAIVLPVGAAIGWALASGSQSEY